MFSRKHIPACAPFRSTTSSSSWQVGGSFRARKRLQVIPILLPLLLILAACGGNSGAFWGPGSIQGNTSTQRISEQGGMIILASPTFQPVLPTLVDAFLKSRNLRIPYAFDFSSSTQVANTANTATAADLLVLDDRNTMIDAHTIGFTQSNGIPLATDRLTVVLPPSNPGKITRLQDLAVPGHRYLGISFADGLSRHIQNTLERMNLDPAFGTSYSARVYGNLFKEYTDGLAAARAIASPNPAGDFAIVYRTNYLEVLKERGAKALIALPIPDTFNPPLEMLAAITSQAINPTISQQFIDFIRSPAASPIWASYGFQPRV